MIAYNTREDCRQVNGMRVITKFITQKLKHTQSAAIPRVRWRDAVAAVTRIQLYTTDQRSIDQFAAKILVRFSLAIPRDYTTSQRAVQHIDSTMTGCLV